MNIENPAALHFIMQDELFFLNEDKHAYANRVPELQVMPEIQQPAVLMEEAAATEWAYMGKKADLLILVHYPDVEFINGIHLGALENILKRKGLAVPDIAILNMAKNTDTGFQNLISYFSPAKMLMLGEKSLPQGIPAVKLNEPAKAENSNILYSFSFDEMMDSPENKKAFWEQMKNF